MPSPASRQTILAMHELSFRHTPDAVPLLQDAHLEIRAHDRILLEGPSGSGKSTLASLLTGLRQTGSGLLMLHGLDRYTLGLEAWRRRVVSAPQFHENHVFTGMLAFNLLMGRNWPPREADLREAESLYRRLGLGDLLDRMPNGLMQAMPRSSAVFREGIWNGPVSGKSVTRSMGMSRTVTMASPTVAPVTSVTLRDPSSELPSPATV
jgi:ABC-type bacteriocin/lantibiotic exporter with double-glycine peptidase domain